MPSPIALSVKIACFAVLLNMTLAVTARQALKAGYFTGANTPGVPDTRVVITNPGVYSGGNLCAMIYVFDQFQEIQECCGCRTTVDGELELSVNTDLTASSLNGVFLHRGAIRIVSNPPNVDGFCDPTTLDNPQPELLAWGTHPARSSLSFLTTITETDYQDVPLSQSEASHLSELCFLAKVLGSGRGNCSCGSGD